MTATIDRPVAWTAKPLALGEGARWVGDRLYLVDIAAGRLLAAGGDEPGELEEVARVGVALGAVAPLAGHPGKWLAAAGTGIAVLEGPGTLSWLERPEDDAAVPARMNDAAADPAGRFWAGSMAWDATEGSGSLYRLDTGGNLERVVELPASQPSSVCLGGPGRRRLFMTTATTGLERPSPADGLVYALDVDVPGSPACPARLGRR